MDKKAVFKELLDKFETEEVRLYCEDMIEQIPDYIFTMPSSTSGKFHNATQCQTHGQIYHIMMFGSIMNYRLALKCNQDKFSNPMHRDAMRCVSIFHDAIKCGWNGSTFTVHDHPMLAGKWVRETKVEHDISDSLKEIIARMCERHSGEWTSSKRSKVILPEPETEAEIFVHECDILSSRPDIDMQPSEHLSSVLKEESQNQTLPDLYEYRLQFGRHKGRTIPEIDLVDRGWLVWATKNLTKEPLLTMIKNYLEKEDDDI